MHDEIDMRVVIALRGKAKHLRTGNMAGDGSSHKGMQKRISTEVVRDWLRRFIGYSLVEAQSAHGMKRSSSN
jgi:hypothetical protein